MLYLRFVLLVCILYSIDAGILGQTKRQIRYVLGMSSHGSERPNMVDDDDAASDRMKNDIENSQDNALSLCTEKVLLARQAYDLVLLPYCFPSK